MTPIDNTATIANPGGPGAAPGRADADRVAVGVAVVGREAAVSAQHTGRRVVA